MSDKYPDKKVIGLTGNIGTGKSAVRRMLEHLGAFGIDADGLANRVIMPGAPGFQPVVDTFGKWLVDSSGQIDRKKLAMIVFSDEAALKKLEAITHPHVRAAVNVLIKRAKQKVVVVEAIKLLESGMADQYDSVWVVDAPQAVCLDRLVKGRKMPEDEAKSRMAAQSPQAEKIAKASVVIDNSGGYEKTYAQVEKQFNSLMGISEEAAKKAEEAAVEVVTPAVAGEAQVSIKRGGPKDAEQIAAFLNAQQGGKLDRGDVMLRFGQKGYLMALVGEKLVGLVGWQVENLITRVDEFLLGDSAPVQGSVKSLLETLESSSADLQSEILLLALPKKLPEAARKIAENAGFEAREIAELRVPDWREAASELVAEGSILLSKNLRTDRVLKPI